MKLTVAILTISTSVSKKEREDRSGAVILEFVEARGWQVIRQDVVPDDEHRVNEYLRYICDTGVPDLVLTTGGTGISPTDRTPEATRAVVEREVPGIPEAMRLRTFEAAPTSILSRQVAGVRGNALIVNLPGSPAGVRECLGVIGGVIEHACEVIGGRSHDCGSG
jgi:molybdopterin adenylyltransferase